MKQIGLNSATYIKALIIDYLLNQNSNIPNSRNHCLLCTEYQCLNLINSHWKLINVYCLSLGLYINMLNE